MPVVDEKTYENYYFTDEALLFSPGRLSVQFGALVRMPRRWSGLPIAPLSYHPSRRKASDLLHAWDEVPLGQRVALRSVLVSTQGEMERVSAI